MRPASETGRDDHIEKASKAVNPIMHRTPVTYRAQPAELTAPEILAQLAWIGDATGWTGALGNHARWRFWSLAAELVARERSRS